MSDPKSNPLEKSKSTSGSQKGQFRLPSIKTGPNTGIKGSCLFDLPPGTELEPGGGPEIVKESVAVESPVPKEPDDDDLSKDLLIQYHHGTTTATAPICRHCFLAHHRLCCSEVSIDAAEIAAYLSFLPEPHPSQASISTLAALQHHHHPSQQPSRGVVLAERNSPLATLLQAKAAQAESEALESAKIRIAELELELRQLREKQNVGTEPPTVEMVAQPEGEVEVLPTFHQAAIPVEPVIEEGASGRHGASGLDPHLEEFIQQMALRDRERRARASGGSKNNSPSKGNASRPSSSSKNQPTAKRTVNRDRGQETKKTAK